MFVLLSDLEHKIERDRILFANIFHEVWDVIKFWLIPEQDHVDLKPKT